MASDTGSPGFFLRLRRLISYLFRGLPGETPEVTAWRLQSSRSAADADDHRQDAAQARIDQRLAEIQASLDRAKLKSDADAAQHEIKLLAAIIERDRMRVEAETAQFAAQIAIATARESRAQSKQGGD